MLERLRLENFTAFAEADLSFVPGINVIVGDNATGKTHLLKALYAFSATAEPEEAALARHADEGGPEKRLTKKLLAVFRPSGSLVRSLIRRVQGVGHASVRLDFDRGALQCRFGFNGVLILNPTKDAQPPTPVFLGSREALTLLPWFPPLYDKFDLPFDETYADLCAALLLPPLREEGGELRRAVNPPIEAILGGRVGAGEDGFYVQRSSGERLEATLLAEGHRKLAELVRLVDNGSIEPGTLLLWDEPEAGVNPNQMHAVAKALEALARAGVQVVLTTHDLVLPQELSLLAEYPESGGEPPVSVRFFGLSRDPAGAPDVPVRVDAADTLAGLPVNPAFDGLASHHDRAQRLQREELQHDGR